ncbi:MAG: hypothetical protein Fur003_2600 [Candidatus Dojkabacteria bacterium]
MRNWVKQGQNSEKQEKKDKENKEESEDNTESQPKANENDEKTPITDGAEEIPSNKPNPPAATGNWWDYPADIITITSDPNNLNVVVTKKYKLPSTYAPSDLVQIAGTSARVTKTLYIRSVALQALKDLTLAAKNEGIDLSIQSAYRSYQTQVSTYQYWVNYNGGNTDLADQVSARPGHSEHQLGTVVDFSTAAAGDEVGSAFNGSAACKWLEAHASEYGFYLSYPKGQESITGYAYEGWHYRFKGN